MNSYAIISVGGKQYRVREGETLLVDRLAHDEGKTFKPTVLLVGGDGGDRSLAERDRHGERRRRRQGRQDPDRQVPPKNGYKRHTGFRASLSQIEIESIGGAPRRRRRRAEGQAEGGRGGRATITSRACRRATRS